MNISKIDSKGKTDRYLDMIDKRSGRLILSYSVCQLSILLTIVALGLWSHGILQARFEIGFYGLIGGFPITYFVALGILTIASAILWISRESHSTLLFLQLCFFIAAIWLAPIIVGGAQPFASDAYADLGYIEYITRQGNLDPKTIWQHNWPVAWIFWTTLIHVFGISVSGLADLIPWIPFIWQLMLLPVLFVFFRNTIGKAQSNYCWAAMWLFYFGNWFETQNTGSQAFGVFFLFSILAVLTMTWVGKRALRPLGHLLSTTVILAASAVAHLLGSLVTLAVVAGQALARRLKVVDLVLLAILFIATWSMYGAMTYFEWRLPDLWESALRLDLATERGILNPLSGGESHAAVARVRILFSGLVVAVAIIGGLVGWKLRNNRYADFTVLAVVVGCGLAAVGVGAGYAHELYQRFFTFLLPAIAYFGVKSLLVRPVRIVLVLLLLVGLPLTFVAKYGNQTIDYLGPDYLSGATFFHKHTAGGYVTAKTPLGRMSNYEKYRFRPAFEDLEWRNDELCQETVPPHQPHYVCVSSHDRQYYAFFKNKPGFIEDVEERLRVARNCNLVYANTGLRLYVSDE